jgi:hypothetical protein
MVNLKRPLMAKIVLYVIYAGKTSLCGIEQVYNQGAPDWKPVSCHLYPVRIKDFTEFAAVNYEVDICDPACSLARTEVPVYKFVKEAFEEGL